MRPTQYIHYVIYLYDNLQYFKYDRVGEILIKAMLTDAAIGTHAIEYQT